MDTSLFEQKKIALCFIISYNHTIAHERLWREWISYNSDIINVYIYYRDEKLIKSPWILNHCIPKKYISPTTYTKVLPAYFGLLRHVLNPKFNNQWIIYVTETCCPIVSPLLFRYQFFTLGNRSIMRWKYPWWNMQMHKRANLARLQSKYHLANDPWFILTRADACFILSFIETQKNMTTVISEGLIANESIFAIALKHYGSLHYVINETTHIADWSRMTTPTSPYFFKEGTPENEAMVSKMLAEHPTAFFIRKVSPCFPARILQTHIYKNHTLALWVFYIWSAYFYYIVGLFAISIVFINV